MGVCTHTCVHRNQAARTLRLCSAKLAAGAVWQLQWTFPHRSWWAAGSPPPRCSPAAPCAPPPGHTPVEGQMQGAGLGLGLLTDKAQPVQTCRQHRGVRASEVGAAAPHPPKRDPTPQSQPPLHPILSWSINANPLQNPYTTCPLHLLLVRQVSALGSSELHPLEQVARVLQLVWGSGFDGAGG